MRCRAALFSLLTIAVAGPHSTALGQALRYRFQPGEHIYYHYTQRYEVDRMRTNGNHTFTATQEADPEFIVKRVDERGGALMDLAIRNRYLKRKQSSRYLSYTNLIPASEMFLTSEGRFLTGRVFIDDTLRTLSRKLSGIVPDAVLLSDNEVLFWTARRLWFAWDSLPADRDTFTVTREFDTAIDRRGETTMWVKDQFQPVVTVEKINSNHSGTTTYVLSDTLVSGTPYSHLHYVTSSLIGPLHYQSTVHLKGELVRGSFTDIVGDVLFRKEDGIPYLWHVATETHNGGRYAQYNEIDLKLQKMEVIH